ncbi:MAG: CoB--CoM heterodisulfide reductase iron-sulfur subunit A family protein [Bacteroidia bacterium]|nr:CoB--CoM heterodisulfide reductase iron-sulfur subunit A family protein [Bacteroidia bacterium]
MKSSKKVVTIGGGIAGMEASSFLAAMGYDVTLLEKAGELGGHLAKWEKLFPTMRLGKEVLNFLSQGIYENVKVLCNAFIERIDRELDDFRIYLADGKVLEANAILVTTGYDLFDARKKEEYGYGIYDNVITSADLEEFFSSGKEIRTASGKTPASVGFVHCVGSRDQKIGNVYCSKVCCVTAVKQSIELKEKLSDVKIFCFYMDMRMYGMHFEALYKEAQEKWGVQFIRGRVSEACENSDGSILVKVEDTLAGRPMRLTVDMLVLMVGFVPSEGTKKIGNMLNLEFGPNRFFKTRDQHVLTNVSNVKGVFFAGACTAPKEITHAITDARAAASTIASYLEQNSVEKRTI